MPLEGDEPRSISQPYLLSLMIPGSTINVTCYVVFSLLGQTEIAEARALFWESWRSCFMIIAIDPLSSLYGCTSSSIIVKRNAQMDGGGGRDTGTSSAYLYFCKDERLPWVNVVKYHAVHYY